MRIHDAIRIAVNCAEKYENEVRNRNLLFLFQDKGCRINGIELIFRAQHFMHLTGLKAKNKQHPISAPDFYKKCLLSQKKIKKATHNITIYRYINEDTKQIVEDYDDDGEDGAGFRVLGVVQKMKLTNL